MQFIDALKELKNDKKIRKSTWDKGIYLAMNDNIICAYDSKISCYLYDEQIFFCGGWLIEGIEKEFVFFEIIDYLTKGHKAKLKHWKDTYIYLDIQSKNLVLHELFSFNFTIPFESFISKDWVII